MLDETEDQQSYSFEDLWAMARRGRWWLLLPLFVCWLAIWGVSWLLPASYQSEALILVEQQKVPEHYVLSNVTEGLPERLQSMTQQILSRGRLQSIIDRFHLYPSPTGLRKFLQSEDPLEQMRRDIKIEAVQAQVGTTLGAATGRPNELTAFRISYATGSPELAQQVNSELTSLFINESWRSQQQLSESTTSFLASQLKEASDKLEEQEKLVRAFKARHLGDLPSQLQSNVEILSGLQFQLQNVQHAIDSARQQKLYLESQLQQLQSAQGAMSGGEAGLTSLESLQKQLLDLRNRLVDARSRYTEHHPDIVALQRSIAETESLIKEFGGKPSSGEKTEADSTVANKDSAEAALQIPSSPLMQIRSQLKANAFEIQNNQRQEERIQAEITAYQTRLNMTPATEQELDSISRGYEESKANYNSLLQKQNQSQLATSLEERQQGKQFRILDPPSLPDKPKSPNHLFLSLAGLGLGSVLGLGLVALRELTNARVWKAEDLEGAIPARVLVRIPHIDTPWEGRLRAQTRWLEVVAVLAMAILIAAGNLYAFYKG
jgi:polysaccharide chain length determinant protein (PEP-CTERM system associated)